MEWISPNQEIEKKEGETLSEKIIVESIYGESNGGRRPVLYSIPEDKYLVIGIDILLLFA